MSSFRFDNLTWIFMWLLKAIMISRPCIEELSVHTGDTISDDKSELYEYLVGIEIDQVSTASGWLAAVPPQELRGCFEDLKTLRLTLNIDYNTVRDQRDDGHLELYNDCMSWLRRFVGLAPKLEHLSLKFDEDEGAHYWSQGRNGLQMTEPLVDLLLGSKIPHLSILVLENATVPKRLLKAFLAAHDRTLTNVTLSRIGGKDRELEDHSWREVLRSLTSASLVYAKLHCLYEPVRKVVVFDGKGFESCTHCNRLSFHKERSRCFRLFTCSHLLYESKIGNLPGSISIQEIQIG